MEARELERGIFVAGTEPDVGRLHELGFKSLVDVRGERLQEQGLEAQREAHRLGMAYRHVPVSRIDAPSIRRFGRQLRTVPRPVLVVGDGTRRPTILTATHRVTLDVDDDRVDIDLIEQEVAGHGIELLTLEERSRIEAFLRERGDAERDSQSEPAASGS